MALNAKQVELLVKAGKPGRVGAGDGLYLQVTDKGASWLFRFQLDGKARAMGLGAYPTTSLAHARDAALTAKAMTRAGVDPITARGEERRVRSQRQAHAAGATTVPTFQRAAELYIADQAAGWRNPKHAAQWPATLSAY